LALAIDLKAYGYHQQRILSLLPPDETMKQRSEAAGIAVVSGTEQELWIAECAAAEIVQVYFWNSPTLYEFFSCDLPAMRCVVWLQVNCMFAPHALAEVVVRQADAILASSSLRPARGSAAICGTIRTVADFARLADFQPVAHAGFNIGYLGTVDPVKTHPRYVSMSAAVEIPGVRFLIYGSGDGFKSLQLQAQALGVSERFSFLGFTENIGGALSELDLLGYPLCEDNYSTSELVLQEALYAGVTPVVFSYGGAAELVLHEKTGFVVNSEGEYKEAIEYLFRNPAAHARMKEAGKLHAREHFAAGRSAEQFSAVYTELRRAAKSSATDASLDIDEVKHYSGSLSFVRSLGDYCACFRVSLLSADEMQVKSADEEIGRITAVVASPAGGGVFDYARFYRTDPYLRLWCGLILESQGRFALALAEYHQAQRLGLSERRLSDYIERANAKAISAVNSIVNSI